MEWLHKKKKWMTAATVFLIIMLLCTLISRSVYAQGLPQITAAKRESRRIGHTVEAEGMVEQGQESASTVPAGVRVDTVQVQVGDSVEAGTVLFTLDQEDLQQQIAAKELEIRKLELQIESLTANQNRETVKEQLEQNRSLEDYALAEQKNDTAVRRAQEKEAKANAALNDHNGETPAVTSEEERKNQQKKYEAWLSEGEQLTDTLQSLYQRQTELKEAIKTLEEQIRALEQGQNPEPPKETEGTDSGKQPALPSEPEGETGTDGGSETEPGSAPESDAVPDSGSETTPENEAGTESGSTSEPGTETKPENGSETVPENETGADSGSEETAPESEAVPESGSITEPESGSEETASESEAGTDSGSEETAPENEAGTESGSEETASGSEAVPESGEGTAQAEMGEIAAEEAAAAETGKEAERGEEADDGAKTERVTGTFSLQPLLAAPEGGAQGDSSAALEALRQQLEEKQAALSRTEAEIAEQEKKLEAYQETPMEKPDYTREDSEKEVWDTEQKQLEEEKAAAVQAREDALWQKMEDLLSARRKAEDASLPAAADSTLEVTQLEAAYQREVLAAYRKLSEQQGKIVSETDAVVTGIKVSPGERTGDGAAVVYARLGGRLRFRTEISKADKKYVEIGSEVELTFGMGEKMTAEVSYLAQAEGSERYEVFLDLPEGVGRMGQSGTMRVSAESEKQDSCIPAAALRKEGDRDVIYVVRRQQGILGEELAAEKRLVTVLDQNEQYAALAEGALDEGEEVILSSTKELSDGAIVKYRLE